MRRLTSLRPRLHVELDDVANCFIPRGNASLESGAAASRAGLTTFPITVLIAGIDAQFVGKLGISVLIVRRELVEVVFVHGLISFP